MFAKIKTMFFSFRMKMVLPVVITVMLAFIIAGMIIFNKIYEEAGNLAEENAWNLAYRNSAGIKSMVDRGIALAKSMSHDAELFSKPESEITRDAVVDLIASILKDNPYLFSVWIMWEPNRFDGNDATLAGTNAPGTAPDGRFAPVASRAANGVDISYLSDLSSDFYKTILADPRIRISEPFPRKYNGTDVTIISVSYPVWFNNRVIGAAGVDVKLDDIIQFLQITVYKTGYAFMLSYDQTIIAHPTKSVIGTKASVATEIKPFMERGEPYLTERPSTATGKMSFTFYAPIHLDGSDYKYYFGLSVPKAEVFDFLDEIKVIIAAVAIGAIILTVIVVLLNIRVIMKLLGGEPEVVIKAVKEIAAGDFTSNLVISDKDKTSLAYSIKDMTKSLSLLIDETIDIADKLNAASSSLSTGVSKLSKGMNEQSQRSELISSAANEMSATTGEIAKNLTEISVFSNETANMVVIGRKAVDVSTEEITKIKDTADHASLFVSSLGDKSNEIYHIVGAITDIAEQTNLLALNAAIEAARAGDAGRGFAVVADEVRKLAERTQKSTLEISGLVSATQNEVNNVINAMSGVTEQVNMGVELSGQVTEELQKIEKGVKELHSMVDSISSATHEMATTSSNIQHDIDSVAVVSNEVSLTADSLAESASSLDKISGTLKKMMSRFTLG